jgi:hypothetical protein
MRWLHMKIPALGNVSHEASRTADGRQELEKMLKIMENEVERSTGKLKHPSRN